MKICDKVYKVSGDYHLSGVVVGQFNMRPEQDPQDPQLDRLVVRHEAAGGGYFCHVYKAENLVVVDPLCWWTCLMIRAGHAIARAADALRLK